MKPLQQWFDEYSESHQNKTNKIIHYFCVPAIFFALVALMWKVVIPYIAPDGINVSSIAFPLVLFLFYFRLSKMLTFFLLLLTACCLAVCALIESQGWSVFYVGLVIFIVAWIGQFIGHHIEGKKPSFFKDVQFLLIGPAWVLVPLLERLGWRLEEGV